MIAQKTDPKEAQAKLEHQELRAVRHPTNIDKIRNAVPPAVNVLPVNSLPGWKNYPLEKKFPRVPANKHEFVFGRNAIGEKIFVSGCDFDLDDPHMQATPRGYESLHDPHLKSYFLKHPEVFEKLVEHGFVERDGSVNTSLKEFNQYRAYLGRMRNCVVDGDLGYQDGLAKQQRSQMKRIVEMDKRQKGKVKEEVKARHLAALRKQQDRRQLRAQLKDTGFFQRVREKEREAAINAVKREALAQKVRTRLAKLRRAERRRVRRILLEWYCKQLYADMMRKALREHKQEVREKDLDSFVKAKREFQELKIKWLDNLREKRDAERECAGKHRRRIFDKIESGRMDRMRKKAMEEEIQAKREVYLARKFGLRWLASVRQQRKYAQNYHDSVWRVRKQLVEMVSELKNESGRVNFTSFIKGLIKLKPGRDSVEMSEETREIMNYILDLLIKTAFDTYRKNHKACEKAYDDLHNRRRILGVKDLTEDDFREPAFRVREKVDVPFHRPFLPCDHVCTKIGNKKYVESPECEEERERLRMLKEAEELACEEIDRVCGDRERLGRVLGRGGKGRGFGKGIGGDEGREKSKDKGKSKGKGKEKKLHDVGRRGDQSSDSSAVAERVSKGALKKGMGRIMTATSGDSSDVARKVVSASLKKAVSDLACPDDNEWGGEGVGDVPKTGLSGDSSDVARKVVSESMKRAVSDLACDEEWGGEGEGEEVGGDMGMGDVPESLFSGVTSEDAAKLVSSSLRNVVSDLGCDEEDEGEGDGVGGDGLFDGEWEGEGDDGGGLGDRGDLDEWDGEGAGERPPTGLSGDSSDVAGRVVSQSLLKAVSDLSCLDEEEEEGDEDRDDGGGLGDRDGGGKSGRSERGTSSSGSSGGSSGGVDKVVSESMRKAVDDLSCVDEEEEEEGDEGGRGGEGVGDGGVKEPVSGRSEDVTSSSGSSGGVDKVVGDSLRKAVSELVCPEDEEEEGEGGQGGLAGDDRDDKDNKSGRSEKSSSGGSSGGADKVVADSLRKAVSELSCPDDEEGEEGLEGDNGMDDKEIKSGRSEKSSSGSSGGADKVVADSLKKAVSDLSCPDDVEDEDESGEGDDGKAEKSGRSEKSSSGSSGGADKVVADSLKKAVSELSCPEDEERENEDETDDEDRVPPLTAIEREDWLRGQETGRSTESSEEAQSIVAESVKCAVGDLACEEEDQEDQDSGEDKSGPDTGRSSGSSEAKSLVTSSLKCAVDDLACQEEEEREPEIGKSGPETGRSSGSSDEAKSLVTDSLKCAVGDLACEEGATDQMTPDSLFDKDPESRGDGPGDVGKSGPETGRSSGSSEEAKSIVADSLKCAVGDLACEEQEAEVMTADALFGRPDESGGDGPGWPDTGRSSGSSADAKSLVADSLKCAVGDLECEEEEGGEVPGDDGGKEDGKGGPETGRSSGSSEEAKSIVAESVKCAVDDLACEEGGEEDDRDGEGGVGDVPGKDDLRDGKEPKSERSEGTSSSGGSDGVVGESLKKAMSDLSCPEDDEEGEEDDVKKEHDDPGKEPKSGRSEATTSSGSSGGANDIVENSLKKAVSDLSCVADDEEEVECAEVEEGCEEDDKECVAAGDKLDKRSSEVIPGGVLSAVTSEEAEGLVSSSLRNAVSDLACDEEDGGGGPVGGERGGERGGVQDGGGDEGSGTPGDNRGGVAPTSAPGSQRSSQHDDCSSLLDVMAKEITNSILPGASVSSSYFRDIDNARTYSGPVFPLDGRRSVGGGEGVSGGGEPRGVSSQPQTGSGSRPGSGSGGRPGPGGVSRPGSGSGGRPGSGSGGRPGPASVSQPRSGSGTRPASGSGSRPGPGSGTQPVSATSGDGVRDDALAAAGSGTTPPRQAPSRPGSGSVRRLPSDMRENVLRTLSNVQHQLDAIRQELRNYGVIPRGDQSGNSGGS